MPRDCLDKQKYEVPTAVDRVGASACIPEVGVALFDQEFGTEPGASQHSATFTPGRWTLMRVTIRVCSPNLKHDGSVILLAMG